MQTIDLNKFHTPGTIVLSGRPKGESLREKLNLDRMESEADQIQVIVPDEVVSLNSSFFSGLFGPSIQRMGEARFKDKYIFECLPLIHEDVEAGIKEALKKSNPLGKPALR